jgi:pimeloyl-ACP methyl ester carboxylesterase
MPNALLVHGLGRTPVSMTPLAGPICRSGFRPGYFAYSATLQSLPAIVDRLVARVKADRPRVVVGHSLGGILLRHALARCPDLPVEHLFMLGTPNRSPRVARYFWPWLPFRVFSGSCGQFLAHPDAYEGLVTPAVPYTVFAGTVGLPRLVDPFHGEPNDGIVSVSETRIEDDRPPVEVQATHSIMMFSRRVHERIRETLRPSTSASPSGAGRV